MMEAVSSSETSIAQYPPDCMGNIPEDSHLCTRSCENLKSHQTDAIF
jgi:hypothetical protein